MSATIEIGKLKFSVFGKGYENTRNNSGSGAREGEVLNYAPRYGEIDATGRYLWLCGDFGLRKIDTFTWTEVSMGDIPNWHAYLNHPKNVSNNIGICCDNYNAIKYAYLFDLTTNEIISEGEMDYPPSAGAFEDCILDDDIIKFASLAQGRAGNVIKTLDINDFTMTNTGTIGRAFVGFTDDTHIYCYYPKEWFYQDNNISLITTSGGWIWDIQQDRFDQICMRGLTRGGKIYLPSAIGGKWVLGEYPQTPAPDVNTPAPSRYFGEFSGFPETEYSGGLYIKYSTLRDLALMTTQNVGTYVVDFNESGVYKISDANDYQALAINDEMAVVQNRTTRKTEVIMF